MNVFESDLISELEFKASRSGGKGGQNVNKVESKIELVFDIQNSAILTDEQKVKIADYLSSKLDSSGKLHITSQKHRSQAQNKSETIAKLYEYINKALAPKRKRKKTGVPRAAKEKRLASKKINSAKKQMRNKNIDGTE